MNLSNSDLRPLALGELIDRSATFWRKHLKALFLLSLGFNLVSYIITKSFQLAMRPVMVLIQEAAKDQSRTTEALGAYGEMLVGMVGMMVATFWLYWLSTLVVARYVVPTQLGEPVSPADCFQRARQKLGAFTGAYLLSLLWAVGINLLLAVPGGLVSGGGIALAATSQGAGKAAGFLLAGVGVLLMVLGLVGGILWYLLRFSFLAPVLAMEDLSAVASFRRSGELLSGRVGPGFTGRVKVRAMILVTVVSAILIAVSLVVSLPALVIQLAHGGMYNPESPVPQLLLVPAELLQVAGQAVFNPLALVFYAMFYLDMRVRREGLDLEQRLEARSATTVAA